MPAAIATAPSAPISTRLSQERRRARRARRSHSALRGAAARVAASMPHHRRLQPMAQALARESHSRLETGPWWGRPARQRNSTSGPPSRTISTRSWRSRWPVRAATSPGRERLDLAGSRDRPPALVGPAARSHLGRGGRLGLHLCGVRGGVARADAHGDGPQLAYLSGPIVDPEWWGEGIGEALLEETIAVLEQLRFVRVGVAVPAGNRRGRGFLERAGWEETPAPRPQPRWRWWCTGVG